MRNRVDPIVPSPNDWLRQLMNERKISTRKMAYMLGCSASQVSRWLSLVETIPLEHLLCIAQLISPQSYGYLSLLKNCEEVRKAFSQSCQKFQKTLSIQFDICPFIEKMIDDLIPKPFLSPYQVANLYLHHLILARFAIRLLIESANTDFTTPWISAEISFHLRHPMNQVIGHILSLPHQRKHHPDYQIMCDFRNAAIAHLRKMTLQPFRKRRSLETEEQFSFYFLSRYGDHEDRILVQDLLPKTEMKKDLLVRRLIYSGVIQGTAPQLEDAYIRELENDPEFLLLSLQFDAFHYGDICLNEQRQIPKEIQGYQNTVEHIFRHLQNRQLYPCIQEVESFKLIQLMRLVGPSILKTPHLLVQVKHLQRSSMLKESHPYRMRQELLRLFHRFDIR